MLTSCWDTFVCPPDGASTELTWHELHRYPCFTPWSCVGVDHVNIDGTINDGGSAGGRWRLHAFAVQCHAQAKQYQVSTLLLEGKRSPVALNTGITCESLRVNVHQQEWRRLILCELHIPSRSSHTHAWYTPEVGRTGTPGVVREGSSAQSCAATVSDRLRYKGNQP